MAAAGGLVLAIVCITIVGLGLGLAVGTWTQHEPTWAPRIARGTVVTVGITCLFLAELHVIAQVLP